MQPCAFGCRALTRSNRMTELMIYRPDGWTHLDLFEGEEPTLVLQQADVAQLQDFKTSYSLDFEIPMTARNRETLGFPEIHDLRGDVPYIELSARVYVDGAEVIGRGFKLIVDEVTDVYSVRLVAVTADLFKRLEELKIEDLSLTSFTWTSGEIENPGVERFWPLLPAAYVSDAKGLGRKTLTGFYSSDYGGQYIDSIAPAYSLRYLVEKIFEHEGFTLDVNLPDVGSVDDVFFTLSNLKANIGDLDYLAHTFRGPDTKAQGELDTPIPLVPPLSAVIPYQDIRYVTDMPNPQVDERPLLPTLSALAFAFAQHATFRVRITTSQIMGSSTLTNDFRVRFRVAKYQKEIPASGVVIGEYFDTSDNLVSGNYYEDFMPDIISETDKIGIGMVDLMQVGSGIWESSDFEVAPGERVFIEAYIMYGGTTSNDGVYSTFELIPVEEDSHLGAGAIIHPEKCTHFKNAKEAVQLFAYIYGLSVSVDAINGVVQMFRLEDIDFTNPIDWGNKIAKLGRQINFTAGTLSAGLKISTQEALPYPIIPENGNSITDFIDTQLILSGNINAGKDPSTITLPVAASVRQLVHRNDSRRVSPTPAPPSDRPYYGLVAPRYEVETRATMVDVMDVLEDSTAYTEVFPALDVWLTREVELAHAPTEVISVSNPETGEAYKAKFTSRTRLKVWNNEMNRADIEVVYTTRSDEKWQGRASRPVISLAERFPILLKKRYTGDLNTAARFCYIAMEDAVGGAEVQLPVDFLLPNPVSVQDIIDANYSVLRDQVLARPFAVECDVRLSPQDIADLDFRRPILLPQYGDYFYLNKIDKYSPGHIARATFVALNMR